MSSRRSSKKSKKQTSALSRFKPVILVSAVIIIFFILVYNIIFGGKNEKDVASLPKTQDNQANTENSTQGTFYGPPTPKEAQNTPAEEPKPEVQTVSVTVPPGSYASDVAKLMYEAKVIEDEDAFLNRIIELNKAASLQCGTFEIPSGATVDEIINMISK